MFNGSNNQRIEISSTGMTLQHTTGFCQITAGGGDCAFSVGGSERMRIFQTDGDTSIGETANRARLSVKGQGTTNATRTFEVRDNSGNTIIEANDGQEFALYGATPVTQGAALTASLTSLTQAGTFTPDYAIQAMTNTSPYGFATLDEAETVLSVILNMQTKIDELENRLDSSTGIGVFV
jgi:hypothetical protein